MLIFSLLVSSERLLTARRFLSAATLELSEIEADTCDTLILSNTFCLLISAFTSCSLS